MSKVKFERDSDRLVIAGALRTPIGQAGKSLSKMQSFELGEKLIKGLLDKTKLDKENIDGVIVGEIGQSSKAPNSARVLSVKTEIPLSATAATVANNCVSGYEAINEAARRIILGENETILVVGQESMSNFPVYLDNIKRNPKTATVAKIQKNWNAIPEMEEIKIIDGVEEGLNDPVRDAMMFTTAEIVAQKLNLSKEELDEYAYGSYKKTWDAISAGKYNDYIFPIEHEKGLLEVDEYIASKTSFIEKPERFAKATPIYNMLEGGLEGVYKKYKNFIGKEYTEEKKPVVSLFNSCPQSDGAAALILTTESKAKKLNLRPLAAIKGWGNYGVDPSIMGLSVAYSMEKALENTNLKWDQIDFFEIHEAFAATALGSMILARDELGYDLVDRLEKGHINPNGGTLAQGHPLGATGIRVAINQIMALQQNPQAKYSMGGICAGGGVGGALILEKI